MRQGFLVVLLSLGTRICYTGADQQSTGTPLPCLRYGPAIVDLSGRLVGRTGYGPPGFGESPDVDKKWKVPILLLSNSVDVCGDTTSGVNTSTFRDVKQMQVVFYGSLSATRFFGHRVVLTGTLFEKVTMNHHTDVLVLLRTICTDDEPGGQTCACKAPVEPWEQSRCLEGKT